MFQPVPLLSSEGGGGGKELLEFDVSSLITSTPEEGVFTSTSGVTRSEVTPSGVTLLSDSSWSSVDGSVLSDFDPENYTF